MIHSHNNKDDQGDACNDGQGDLCCAVGPFAHDFACTCIDGEVVQFVVVPIGADPGGQE